MEELRREILQKMHGVLTEEQEEKLRNALDIALYRYRIESKTEEVAIYDNSNDSKIKRFIATKRLEGLSDSTLEQYYRTVTNLVQTLGKHIADITTDDIRYYLSIYQEKRKVSKVTINNMRRYFSTFFGWCCDEDIIEKNPMRRIKAIKQQKVIKEPFSDVEMEKIRQSANKVRNRALVEFLYTTGCRVSEVVGININHVDFSKCAVVVTGKGNKQREVYITDRAMYWLKMYLDGRRDNNIALFIGKGCKRLNKAGIESVVKNIGKKAGISNVHPHRFRRTLATDLINKGMPIQEVQQLLGHTSVDTTMVYCTIDRNNVQSGHRKFAA